MVSCFSVLQLYNVQGSACQNEPDHSELVCTDAEDISEGLSDECTISCHGEYFSMDGSKINISQQTRVA